MLFMDWIVQRLNDISGFFYDLYLDCLTAGFPLDVLATWFLYLSGWFSDLAWDFSDFGTWVNEVAAKVADMLSWTTVWSNIISIVPNLEDIRDWFYDWWVSVDLRVTTWWTTTSTTVLDWIDQAKVWAKLWIDDLQDQATALGVRIADLLALIPDVSEIQTWFTDWTGNVSSVITTWWTGALAEVSALINSAFVEREPFWAGWQDWRDKVTEFFTDPEDWLYKSLDRIIERFW